METKLIDLFELILVAYKTTAHPEKFLLERRLRKLRGTGKLKSLHLVIYQPSSLQGCRCACADKLPNRDTQNALKTFTKPTTSPPRRRRISFLESLWFSCELSLFQDHAKKATIPSKSRGYCLPKGHPPRDHTSATVSPKLRKSRASPG